jgi:hypothetical protein
MERILRHLPENPEVHYYMGRMLGEGGNTFLAHVHLAYSALYKNNKKETLFHLHRANEVASEEQGNEVLEKLEKRYEERSEFWKEE